ncbi:MAG TPA: hypothetical protein VMV09_02015 [Candidatus Saccharimonadales bacterium]|nr:hypothetical protein [Candidatus Saccharimonadales bacterium]
MSRIKSALALVGACAALAIVVPPLAGLLNAIGSVTLLALAGYSAYRGWAWMESVVEASRRPTAVRRNTGRSDSPDPPNPSLTRRRQVARAGVDRDSAGSEERGLRRLQLRQAVRSWPER